MNSSLSNWISEKYRHRSGCMSLIPGCPSKPWASFSQQYWWDGSPICLGATYVFLLQVREKWTVANGEAQSAWRKKQHGTWIWAQLKTVTLREPKSPALTQGSCFKHPWLREENREELLNIHSFVSYYISALWLKRNIKKKKKEKKFFSSVCE